LPVWSNITDFELATYNQLSEANVGDADALLMLYLVASGDSRSFAQFNQYLKVINDFVKSISPQIIHESSEWHKGFILLQAMHEHFFVGGKSDPEKGYSVEQSKLTGIFESRRFNCISSSLLFTLLARKFDLDVKGVLLPSHAFVQLKLSNGKILDIETTSTTGYDWVHDQAFYQKTDIQWFQQRGLSPSTYEDYKTRKIVSPLMLGLDNMTHQHTAKARMNEESRARIVELLSFMDPSNLNAHKARLYFYNNEFVRLNENNDYIELDRMYQQISLFLDSIQKYKKKDDELANMLGWIGSQMAFIATKLGRYESALVVARSTMSELSDAIKDKEKIVSNIFTTLNLVSQSYTNQQEFVKSMAVYQGQHSQCIASKQCSAAVAYLYSKWASNFWDKKQWSKVIERYSEYLTFESSGKAVDSFRENMQSAYINWANEFHKTGDWLAVERILTQCIQSSGEQDKCQNNLAELSKSHSLD